MALSFGVAAATPSVAAPIGSALSFMAVPPKRILDTRVGLGAGKALVAPGGSVTLAVAGQGGVPASGASTVVLIVTVTQATRAGFVQVFPTGQAAVGSSSNLNVEAAGQTIANLVTAPVGANGTVTIYTAGGGHLIADVFGYYSPSGRGRRRPVHRPRPDPRPRHPAGQRAGLPRRHQELRRLHHLDRGKQLVLALLPVLR